MWQMHKVLVLLVLLATPLVWTGCKSLVLPEVRRVTPGSPGETPPLVPPLEEVWRFDADAGFGQTTPVLVGPYVVIATRQGEVYGIALEDGQNMGKKEFGDTIEGTPAVIGTQLVVPVAWGGRALQAYDLRNGRRSWRHRGTPVEADVLGLEDHVVVVAVDGSVHKRSVETGEEVWTSTPDRRITVHAAPVLTEDDQLFVAALDGSFRVLDATTGALLHEGTLPAPVVQAPTVHGTVVYISTTQGQVVALESSDWSLRWSVHLADAAVRLTTPALNQGDLVVTGSDGLVRLLSADTGGLVWTYDSGESYSAPALFSTSYVYAAGLDGRIVALDRTRGTESWRYSLGGRVKSPMRLTDNGLLVQAEPRHVYLFAPERPTVTTR